MCQVGFHELIDKVEVGEVLVAARLDDVEDAYDVLVGEVAHELGFSEGALRFGEVLEGVLNLFDSDILSALEVPRRAEGERNELYLGEGKCCKHRLPYDSVRPPADWLDDLIPWRQVEDAVSHSHVAGLMGNEVRREKKRKSHGERKSDLRREGSHQKD